MEGACFQKICTFNLYSKVYTFYITIDVQSLKTFHLISANEYCSFCKFYCSLCSDTTAIRCLIYMCQKTWITRERNKKTEKLRWRNREHIWLDDLVHPQSHMKEIRNFPPPSDTLSWQHRQFPLNLCMQIGYDAAMSRLHVELGVSI